MSGFQIFAAETAFQNRAAHDFLRTQPQKLPIISRFLPESLGFSECCCFNSESFMDMWMIIESPCVSRGDGL